VAVVRDATTATATRLATLAVLAVASALASERSARAEDIPVETADGVGACREFAAKNERELAQWSKDQPATPYKYPHDGEVLGAPWGPFTKGVASTYDLILATLVPHVGAQYRLDTPAAVVAWPMQIPIGPAYTCSRRQGSFNVRTHRAHRLMLEPGVVGSNRGVGVFVRPGYRFIFQPSDWVVGPGAGVGSTIEIAGNREPMRASISPEAVLRFGHCCEAGYFTLAFRYDHYFGGTVRDILGGTLGFVYF
jgi:hypothetical protein